MQHVCNGDCLRWGNQWKGREKEREVEGEQDRNILHMYIKIDR
jgi:hypothetical protein